MKANFAVLGGFIVSGFLLFTIGIFLIGNRHEAFTRHEILYIDMASVNGLAPGTQVRVEGFDGGQCPTSQSTFREVSFALGDR
jgi:phospholipid/cholesterol/gamma-HCH transport system substrate-binding protein